MPTTDPMTPGEIARAIDRLERAISSLSEKVVTTATLDLTLKSIQQSMKTMDDRHTQLATDIQKEQDDRKTIKRMVYGAVIAAVCAVIIPLMLRGVGAS